MAEGTAGKEEGLVDKFKRLIRRPSDKDNVKDYIITNNLKNMEDPESKTEAESIVKEAGFNLPDKDATRPLPPLDPPKPPEDELVRLKRETAPAGSTDVTKPLNPQVVEEHEKAHPEDTTNPLDTTGAYTQEKLQQRWKATGPVPVGSVVNTPYVDTKPVPPFIQTEQPKSEAASKPVEDKPLPPMSTPQADSSKKNPYGAY
jgi:hypothetical protein